MAPTPDSPRPIPTDPSRLEVEAMLDIRSDTWWLGDVGDYKTAAVEAMRQDGTDWQRAIAVEWPARRNHSDERQVLRLLISPEDAAGLADTLLHTVAWLAAADKAGL